MLTYLYQVDDISYEGAFSDKYKIHAGIDWNELKI